MKIFGVLNHPQTPVCHRGAFIILDTITENAHYFYPSSPGAEAGAKSPAEFASGFDVNELTIPEHIKTAHYAHVAHSLPYVNNPCAFSAGLHLISAFDIACDLTENERAKLLRHMAVDCSLSDEIRAVSRSVSRA